MSNLERQAKCQKIKLGQYFKHNIARYEKYTHKKKKWKQSDQLCRALKDKIRNKIEEISVIH